MQSEILEKPAPPVLLNVTYMSVEISWENSFNILFNRLSTSSVNKTILAEVLLKKDLDDLWQLSYTGYNYKCSCNDLDPETTYCFRIRFRIGTKIGNWSEIVKITTNELPSTGQDIHLAIKRGDASQLLEALQKSDACIDAPDNLCFTPLMYCAQQDLIDLIIILLEKGANTEKETDSGKTALMFAAFKGNEKCLEALLEYGANVNHPDKNGLTPLHMAVDGEQVRAIKVLLRNGADLEATDYNLRWTPLLRCAGLKNNGNIDVARELVKSGAQIDACDTDGKTALHNCIINGHQVLCQYLLENGASLDLNTQNGYNAVQLVEAGGDQKIKTVVHHFLETRKLHGQRS